MEKNSDARPNSRQDNEHLFIEALAALPEKPKSRRRQNTAYDLVFCCYASLKQAKMKGHSYEDLAALFEKELGRTITPGTLRKYMNRAAKEVGSSPSGEAIPKKPKKKAPVSDPLPRPKRVEPPRSLAPRPTLYTREPGTQVREDEFENL
jgi:hypothetical protein